MVVLLAMTTIDLFLNALRHECTLKLDGTSCLRKVRTYMKHCLEHYLGVRAWSIGTYCSSGLNVMTLTKLIHTVKHTVLHLYPFLYQSSVEDDVISSGLYYLSPLTPTFPPGTHTTELPAVSACVSLTATRESSVAVKGRGRARRQIHLL